jgi:hypothetical protein
MTMGKKFQIANMIFFIKGMDSTMGCGLLCFLGPRHSSTNISKDFERHHKKKSRNSTIIIIYRPGRLSSGDDGNDHHSQPTNSAPNHHSQLTNSAQAITNTFFGLASLALSFRASK